MFLRDQYILSYAVYLHSYPPLWRITVAYMCSCGRIGRERADELLLRVPISFKAKTRYHDRVSAAVHSGEVPAALKAVIETCHEYGRESVRRMVCTVSVLLPMPIPCAFCSGYVTDCSREFPEAPRIWVGCFVCNLGGKLDVAGPN